MLFFQILNLETLLLFLHIIRFHIGQSIIRYKLSLEILGEMEEPCWFLVPIPRDNEPRPDYSAGGGEVKFSAASTSSSVEMCSVIIWKSSVPTCRTWMGFTFWDESHS